MLHACLIVLFASLLLSQQAGGAVGQTLSPAWTVALAVAVPLGWLAWLALGAHRVDGHIGRTGSLRPLRKLDASFSLAVMTSTLAMCVATLLGPWMALIRGLTGDLIVLDEAMGIAPWLTLVVGNWALCYPIQRRLMEAVIFRQIESRLPVHPVPTRGQFVVQQVRHQLLILLVPMGALWALAEVQDRAVERAVGLARRVAAGEVNPEHLSAPAALAARVGTFLATSPNGPALLLILHVLSAALVIVVTPAVVRRLWRTTPLDSSWQAMPTNVDAPPEPALGDDLLAMAREQGVRVGRVLVWQTGGTTINGAVLGFVGRFRYILLTDALLERLPRPQVLAVMAHELGHVRLAHIPWLAVTLFASSSLPLLILHAVARGTGIGGVEALDPRWQLGAGLASLACALVCFGFVSRRFEWQADAFAVRALNDRLGPASVSLSPQACEAMAGALASVADHSGLDRARFGFRHGSINHRLARLRELEHQDPKAIPIDRTAARIKIASAVVASLALAVTLLG